MWKSSSDSGLFEQRKLTAFQVQRLNTFVKVSFEASDDKGIKCQSATTQAINVNLPFYCPDPAKVEGVYK